ncbi:retrovirus-related pol polyprotein from transposon TNT 1-94 [Tanacetum coccineum]
MKIKESLNVTFDETPPPSKTSPLVDDDLDEEEAIKVTEKKNLENDIEDETLEVDEIVNIKESKNHPLGNVIGNLNQRTLRNKLDENGVVSRNKARLVAQGYNQQEGIDYGESYDPVARLESIRILLAYACALDLKLFQMDVKSAFLNGFINEEVYMAQPPGFIDFEKPDHVYKLKKALYGLKQAPKAWYDRLKAFLIKYEYNMGMDTKLTKDEECESVDSTKYRGMIGSLLYLTASRPDIMFSVCLCARFQEDPKTSHLEAVKRIFRYIKGTMHLGLWYPKGTGIETVVYADSDHAGDYIKQRIQAARNRQKSYVDLKRKPMEFQVGDRVMLKVSPWKGVVRFGKWGKLNPRYVGPFKVLEKVGAVAYKLELPQELSRVHNTFHVSNLKKCYADEPLAVPLDGLHIDDKLHFVEEPVEIMDREVK